MWAEQKLDYLGSQKSLQKQQKNAQPDKLALIDSHQANEKYL